MDSQDIRNLQEAYLSVYDDLDEATRMRKELGKEGEIETRKELASRSRAYKRSGSVDKTIAAAERAADWTDDEKKARTLRKLAASRRGSVRGEGGLRGYAAKVEGGDKDLQSARGSARSAGTLTPAEKKKLGEDVYNGLNEAEKWIQKAIEKPGALSKQLGVPEKENIPAGTLRKAAKKGGKLGKRARLAMTLKGFRKEELDLYDILFTHLLDEGYADTEKAAAAIMVNMSEEWVNSILN